MVWVLPLSPQERKRFLPPVFDLRAYDNETESWGYNDWWNALLRRRLALEQIELQEMADPGITSGHGSVEFCKQQVKALLPHLFEKQKMKAAPLYWRTSGPLVRSMEMDRAVLFIDQAKRNPTLATALDYYENNGFLPPGCTNISVGPVLGQTQDHGYDWVDTHRFLVEVNLRAPNAELRKAFEAWLKTAREATGISEPDPKIVNRKTPDLPHTRFREWRVKRVLAFLDLFIYNRLFNPPPVKRLWKKQSNGFWSYKGESWTTPYDVWIALLQLNVKDSSFKNSVRALAFTLIQPDRLSLLEFYAIAESEGNRIE